MIGIHYSHPVTSRMQPRALDGSGSVGYERIMTIPKIKGSKKTTRKLIINQRFNQRFLPFLGWYPTKVIEVVAIVAIVCCPAELDHVGSLRVPPGPRVPGHSAALLALLGPKEVQLQVDDFRFQLGTLGTFPAVDDLGRDLMALHVVRQLEMAYLQR